MASAALKVETISPAGVSLFGSPRKRRLVLCLALALLTLAVFNPVAQNGFVNYDDDAYITRNPQVQAGLTWPTVRWAFTSLDQANYHPLTWLSHALDYQMFGPKPAGHHYMNVLLQALTAVLLFLFLEAVTGLAGRSLVVAALFAVHPVNVESVAWAAERKNVLCALFFVMGLWAYCWYARNPGVKRYLGVAALFAMGLLSKPAVITFPFVLLLLDYWPLGRMNSLPDVANAGSDSQSFTRLVMEKLPLLALSAASAAITLIAQKGSGAVRDEYPFSAKAANAVVSYARYLGKAFGPTHLSAMYPFPRNGTPVWEVVAASLLLLAITGAVLVFRKHRYLAFGWFWFLGVMVPMIGLVQVGQLGLADRYAYLPFIGLFVAVAWLVSDWAEPKGIGPVSLGAAALAVLAVLSVASRVQTSYWRDSLTLWSHALAVTDNNFVAEDNLGAELIKLGRVPEAKAHFEASLGFNPRDVYSLIDLAVCDRRLGDPQGAIEHYQAALRLSTDPTMRSTAFSGLGSLYRKQGNYAAAERNYAGTLAIASDDFTALSGLGLIAEKTGRMNEAVDYFTRAVRGQPSDVGYLLLAQALEKAGQKAQAQSIEDQVKQLSPNIGAAQQAVQRMLQE